MNPDARPFYDRRLAIYAYTPEVEFAEDGKSDFSIGQSHFA